MEGPFLSPPAKRPFYNITGMPENNPNSANGASKRGRAPLPPIVLSPGQVAFRLLCHVSNIGGVIGKSGSIVKQYQKETGAKIRVEEPIPACDERIIYIVAPESPKKKIRLKGLAEGDKEGEVEFEVSSAQEALVRIFERVLEVEAETQAVFPPPGGAVSWRLLAATNQVGAVMGKGGKVIDRIRKENGVKISVLTAGKLPACAAPNDEVIEVTGDILAVKKALIAVSRCLQSCPLIDRTQTVASRPMETATHGTFPDPHGDLFPQQNSFIPPLSSSSVDYASRSLPLPQEIDKISNLDPKKAQQEVSFRLLCSNDKVGGVIGKGGVIVKALQNETGASISVAASVPESDERVITISAMENADSQYSPVQKAVLRVFTRSIEVGIENGLESGSSKGASTPARLLISSNQVGCLMGKGGTIISEMRRVTGAGIRILGGDQVPKCALENDEVVQITGDLNNVKDALYHITGRLRDNIFPNKLPKGAGVGSNSSSVVSEVSPYGRVREPTSGLYPSVGLSHNLDRQTTLTQSMDHLGLSHSLDRPPSPRLWTSQATSGGNPRGITDMGRGLTTFKGGLELGRGSKSAIVTNTTVEIVVPENVLASVYGEQGSNLNRLRQISGAKVMVRDPHSGTSDALVIISGTPDQTQAAQSLLHAFTLSGRPSPDHSRLL
ncbi:PREDICTED: KH domain-containing protein HEN4-like [Nelumbo nucifera]|uniref:KH domain-containing protein HEN4-like n=1 Tax=Nelumbo nucifera TaxID=4432 RepID=A0A1U7ZKL8_NELNU|nr:PREDICTED: KH domain-containing protein HEN4-like [Nelumbo nucifera]